MKSSVSIVTPRSIRCARKKNCEEPTNEREASVPADQWQTALHSDGRAGCWWLPEERDGGKGGKGGKEGESHTRFPHFLLLLLPFFFFRPRLLLRTVSQLTVSRCFGWRGFDSSSRSRFRSVPGLRSDGKSSGRCLMDSSKALWEIPLLLSPPPPLRAGMPTVTNE